MGLPSLVGRERTGASTVSLDSGPMEILFLKQPPVWCTGRTFDVTNQRS